jgi:CubicO group peptidase (beta-lactamase class C family)
MRRPWLALLLLLLPTPLLAEAGPVVSPTGPDAAQYGAAQGYPVGGRFPLPQGDMVGTYSHYDAVGPFHRIARAPAASPLRRAPRELRLTYVFHGAIHTLDDYLARNPVTGLLIARGDTILYEHYQYARTDGDRLLSQSMAKTIVGMLIGVAIGEGRIHSVDDLAQNYVPELAGTTFGQTTLRALLHMASGIAFRQDYTDPNADSLKLTRILFGNTGEDAAHAVAAFNTRAVPPDTHFSYANADTEVLGLVLAHATGLSLSDYLQTRLWQPMGAEADATWTVDRTGQEVAYCCFSAVLRDWARLGLLLARDGATAGGRQLIPRQWVLDATTVPPGSPFAPFHASVPMGYGYQVWLFPGPRRQFALLGIHGQSVYVDPAARLVMVQTAVRIAATGERGEEAALWRAVVARLAGGG